MQIPHTILFSRKYIMKSSLLAVVISLGSVGLAGQAAAACASPASTLLSHSALLSLVTGRTVCVPNGTEWQWQEQHNASGALSDYKRGPGHAVDPSETVGSWSVSNKGGNATIEHNYGSGGTFTYSVWDNNNGTYSFCSGAPEIVATVKTGPGC